MLHMLQPTAEHVCHGFSHAQSLGMPQGSMLNVRGVTCVQQQQPPQQQQPQQQQQQQQQAPPQPVAPEPARPIATPWMSQVSPHLACMLRPQAFH